jgi:hypothetical protein
MSDEDVMLKLSHLFKAHKISQRLGLAFQVAITRWHQYQHPSSMDRKTCKFGAAFLDPVTFEPV